MKKKGGEMRNFTPIQNAVIRSDRLDVYQKSCINNILSNEENFKMSLNALANRIPCSKRKATLIIKELEKLNIVIITKAKTLNGDWDSNIYSINLDVLFKHIEVLNYIHNVVHEVHKVENHMPNGSTQDTLQVVHKVPTKNTNKNIKENIYSAFDSYTINEELKITLKDFAEMRKAIKKPLTTKKAIIMLLNKLDKLASSDNEKKLILEQSIFNNWQGVFILKDQNKQLSKHINIDEDGIREF
ncbi:hypothetical protein GKZ28_25035 [Clostridium chromiireducens]|uniref:Helix-turn-helix domain-containing protein n=1 Tax=Clostridium chromiireducens TaxID=225345 RepID=A0A964RSF6_9CLOT|nr:hypothetical protein [Clostridium chromiireducens]MVX66927.1 hypothetical protein [Clostridium chromiireducens]